MIVDAKQFITYEEAFAILKDDSTDYRIQSAHFDFIQATYVEKAIQCSGCDIDNIWRCYVRK